MTDLDAVSIGIILGKPVPGISVFLLLAAPWVLTNHVCPPSPFLAPSECPIDHRLVLLTTHL